MSKPSNKSSYVLPDYSSDGHTFYSAYFHPRRQPFNTTGASRTKQNFKAECDINVIMAQYSVSGVLGHVKEHEGFFADCTHVDYQVAMDTVAAGNSAFHALPAHIRDRFQNDPGRLLEFVHDPRNAEESFKLGLLERVPDSLKTAAPAAPPGPPAVSTGGPGTTPPSAPAPAVGGANEQPKA